MLLLTEGTEKAEAEGKNWRLRLLPFHSSNLCDLCALCGEKS
jgi:hypothetical protein